MTVRFRNVLLLLCRIDVPHDLLHHQVHMLLVLDSDNGSEGPTITGLQ